MSLVDYVHDDGIGVVVMHDQEGKNAFGEPFVEALEIALRSAAEDAGAHAIVLVGLPHVFASGAPLELLARLARGELESGDLPLIRAIFDVPVPTIAAMEGHATGGGLALGLAADVVVMAEESRYGAPFMNMGFTPGMGMTRLLEHAFSPAIAHELLFGGELRLGRELARRSGVNHVVPRAEVRRKAEDVARRMVDKPRPAIVELKSTIVARRRAAIEEAIREESVMHRRTFAMPGSLARIEDYMRSS